MATSFLHLLPGKVRERSRSHLLRERCKGRLYSMVLLFCSRIRECGINGSFPGCLDFLR